MNAQQILSVAVRLIAIWLFLYALSNITGTYIQTSKLGAHNALQPILWSLGLIVLICSLLWIFPSFIARKILPHTSTPAEKTASFDDWFSLGCSLIGVWVLAKAIPALAGYWLTNYLLKLTYGNGYTEDPNRYFLVSFDVVHIVFGIWLFMGARGLKKAFHWARNV